MKTFILTFHLIVTVAMIIVILIQRSEGGGLGLGGGSVGGVMSARGAANLLTRITAILVTIFIGTSLTLAILESKHMKPQSLLDTPAMTLPVSSVPTAAPIAPTAPAEPSKKSQ